MNGPTGGRGELGRRGEAVACDFLRERRYTIVARNFRCRAGEIDLVDTTSLASLTAGNVAATDGLARLIGEREFTILFHEGRKDNIHISIVGQRLILVVIFDERSSLGLVRLRVRKASGSVEKILNDMEEKAQRVGAEGAATPFAEITDEDIDALFSE